MECLEARELMSDYLEQYPAEPETARLTEHLAGCDDCRAELADLEETLRVVHGLPREEPVLDLWDEFAPKFMEICAETRLGFMDRVRLYFAHLFSAISEGWEIFITTVHYNMTRKIRYTTGD